MLITLYAYRWGMTVEAVGAESRKKSIFLVNSTSNTITKNQATLPKIPGYRSVSSPRGTHWKLISRRCFVSNEGFGVTLLLFTSEQHWWRYRPQAAWPISTRLDHGHLCSRPRAFVFSRREYFRHNFFRFNLAFFSYFP